MDDEDESPREDLQIKKEMEEMSKLKDCSGLGSVIYKELSERKSLPPPALDPWKASRAPSAKYEPKFSTRYQSPMFACKLLLWSLFLFFQIVIYFCIYWNR